MTQRLHRQGPVRGAVRRPRLAVSALLLSLAACDHAGDYEARARIRDLTPPGMELREWPRLVRSGDRVTLSWLETADDGTEALRFATVGPEGSSAPKTVVSGTPFFRNWADFPSVAPLGDSLLLAHWLVRGPSGGYDYGIRMASSVNGGDSWSPPWTPHTDDTPTEHGFATIVPLGESDAGLVWLDGRALAGADPAELTGMSLRFRAIGGSGPTGPDLALDSLTCDCCQTDAARTDSGLVVVYRDRRPGEIRDVAVVRRTPDGWSEPVAVHEDGWVIPACPVNGPALAARGKLLAVAWFTGANDRPRVNVAFSADAGRSFDDPVRVDEGAPFGRVDVELVDGGDAVVSWLERSGEGAAVRIRRVSRGATPGAARTVGSSTGERASGFPSMVLAPWGELLLAWTVPSGSALSRIRLVALEPPSAE